MFNKKYGFNIRGEENFKSQISLLLYRRAYVICTVSDYFTDFINQIGGNAYTQKPILSSNFFPDKLRRKYKLKKKYRILYIGRLDLEKGLIILLEAFFRIKNDGFILHLDIIGDGHALSEINQKIVSLNLKNSVTLHGAKHDSHSIKDFYYGCDIFILPSYHEGFPRVIYEAMLSRIPIITTIVGGMGTLMKDMYNCIEIKPTSIEDLYIKLIFLIRNYKISEMLCENAYLTIAKFFENTSFKQSEILNRSLSENIK